MHVISASRRTDIPAFYAPWLLRRLEAGHVRVPNPFNPRQISTVDLRPEKVAAVVFWTKDPRPLLPHLRNMERRGYRFIFHVTITGLPPALEPGVPAGREIAEAVAALCGVIGPQRIVWRFDPIVLSTLTPDDRLVHTFDALAKSLQGKIRRVAVSFARYYRQVHPRLRRSAAGAAFVDLDRLDPARRIERIAGVTEGICAAAAAHGIEVVSCAETLELSPFGVRAAPCIDAAHLGTLFGLDLSPRKDPGQRAECGCMRSIDIGIYGTCRHRCLYCYARADAALVRGERHDPFGARLIGEDDAEDGAQPRLF